MLKDPAFFKPLILGYIFQAWDPIFHFYKYCILLIHQESEGWVVIIPADEAAIALKTLRGMPIFTLNACEWGIFLTGIGKH